MRLELLESQILSHVFKSILYENDVLSVFNVMCACGYEKKNVKEK